MYLAAERLSPDAGNLGLTQERLQLAAESRLRAARLYKEEFASPFLYVRVSVVDRAFTVEVNFQKQVLDTETAEFGIATTWNVGTIGVHGQSAQYIVSSLSEHLDRFLTECLRVNEAACDG